MQVEASLDLQDLQDRLVLQDCQERLVDRE
jgi:hypothetical protein